MPLRRTLLTLALASGVAVPFARAQTPAAQAKPPAYDVVSIRQNKSSNGVDFDTDDHTYSAKGVSVRQLLESAYNVKGYLISGIPGSIDSARFDINAKILETDPILLAQLGKQRGAMIQTLLADRFKLSAHRETKTLPIYELVVAKGGIKFQPSGPDVPPGTHMRGTGRTGFKATGLFMDGLANYLEDRVERNILDKTGLPGRYDLSLQWAADNADTQSETAPRTLHRNSRAARPQAPTRQRPGRNPDRRSRRDAFGKLIFLSGTWPSNTR